MEGGETRRGGRINKEEGEDEKKAGERDVTVHDPRLLSSPPHLGFLPMQEALPLPLKSTSLMSFYTLLS